MSKYFLLTLLACPVVAFSSPVQNVSDQCSCFSKNNIAWNIDHCAPIATPRLAGVYQDVQGKNVLTIQPGESSDSPPLKDQYGNNMAGLRAPGPLQYASNGGAYFATPTSFPPTLYAVPVYLLASGTNVYLGDALTMLTPRQLDLVTCTYHSLMNEKISYSKRDVIKMSAQ